MIEANQKLRRAPKTGYLPSLDGWRGLAVLGVMIAHDDPWMIFGHSTAAYKGLGGHGVELFFAISGLLITTRILEEERIVGHFDIRRFYVRRLFRIQPAAWAYLTAIAVLMLCGAVGAEWRNWVAALLLFTNYLYHPPGAFTLVGHFWTLAVEEHFYILLSLTLFLVKRYRTPVLGLMFLASIMPSTFTVFYRHGWWRPELAPRATQWQIHLLLLPALTAVLLGRQAVVRAVQRWLAPSVAFLFTAGMIVVHNMAWQVHDHVSLSPFRNLIEQSDYAARWFFTLWIVATVFHPQSWTTRFLEMRWMRFLGRISYSLYLWHVVFFAAAAGATHAPWLLLLCRRPERYVASFAMAALSYYLIEKPLIRKGHKLAPPATPGREDLMDLPVEAPDPGHGSGTGVLCQEGLQ